MAARTAWAPRTTSEPKKFLEDTTPLRLTTTPDTVAEAILYFVAGADVITGETLILDGGMHLQTAPLGRR